MPVPCRESRAAPIADTAGSAVLLGAAVALIVYGATMDPERNRIECASCFAYAMALGPLGSAVGMGASARVGFDRTARCRRLHEWQRACLAGDRNACCALQEEASLSGAAEPATAP